MPSIFGSMPILDILSSAGTQPEQAMKGKDTIGRNANFSVVRSSCKFLQIAINFPSNCTKFNEDFENDEDFSIGTSLNDEAI